MDFSHYIMHTIQHIIKREPDIMTIMNQMFLFLTIRQLWRSIKISKYNYTTWQKQVSVQPTRHGTIEWYHRMECDHRIRLVKQQN